MKRAACMQRYINSIYKHADIPNTLTFKFKNDDSRKPAKTYYSTVAHSLPISTDINECEQGLHTCHPNAVCVNSVGSFTCQCSDGFQGNGRTCTGLLCASMHAGYMPVWLHLQLIMKSAVWSSITCLRLT